MGKLVDIGRQVDVGRYVERGRREREKFLGLWPWAAHKNIKILFLKKSVLSLQETTFQFCKKSQSKKTVQMYFQRPKTSYGKKKKSKYKIAFDARQVSLFC